MYHIPVYRISLVRDGSNKSPQNKITNPLDAVDIIKGYLQGVDREHFVVLLLDTKNKVIGINTVSMGSLNSSIVHPRECFKAAILANAAGLILAHNHPSGDPEPSREDIAVTGRLKKAGELLGIPIIDHIILGDSTYKSLKEMGAL